MPFELFVALRFLREGRAQTTLVLAGATVGVAVIVFLTALISGLQGSLVEQTLSSQPHVILRRPDRAVRVLPPPAGALAADRVEKVPDRDRSIEGWPEALAAIRATPGVAAAAPIAAGAAFATRAGVSRAVALRGVEAESFAQVIRIRDRLVAGAYRVDGVQAVIGAVLAEDLGLAPGDKLRLTTADGRAEVFTVSGVFDLGNRDVNQRWVLVSVRAAQTLLDLEGGITTVEVRGAAPFQAEAVARDLAARTGLTADSWMQTNRQLLVALRSQSASSLMIQTFVVLAVALGIASVLGVSVLQKARQIGILRATGTSTGAVLRVFLLQGAMVGAAGAAGGSLLGAGLALFFSRLAVSPRGEPVFPVDLGPGIFALAAGVALVAGVGAAVFPARRAARLDPATVIRHG
jgi:lipoprotein-releasing system permease protein